MSPIPVIIDTDAALDDYMAILYLLMNPNVQVLGITTTGVGAAHLNAGTTNVREPWPEHAHLAAAVMLAQPRQSAVPFDPSVISPSALSGHCSRRRSDGHAGRSC